MNDASSTSLLALSSILALAVTLSPALSTLCQRVSWKEKRKGYSQLSLRRTPLGPALAVRLKKDVPSYRESNRGRKERQGPTPGVRFTEESVL